MGAEKVRVTNFQKSKKVNLWVLSVDMTKRLKEMRADVFEGKSYKIFYNFQVLSIDAYIIPAIVIQLKTGWQFRLLKSTIAYILRIELVVEEIKSLIKKNSVFAWTSVYNHLYLSIRELAGNPYGTVWRV